MNLKITPQFAEDRKLELNADLAGRLEALVRFILDIPHQQRFPISLPLAAFCAFQVPIVAR